MDFIAWSWSLEGPGTTWTRAKAKSRIDGRSSNSGHSRKMSLLFLNVISLFMYMCWNIHGGKNKIRGLGRNQLHLHFKSTFISESM